MRDLTGQRFGRILVVTKGERRAANGSIFWRCRCDCGTEKEINGTELVRGSTRSCGCIPSGRPPIDMTGQRFGRLVCVAPSDQSSVGDGTKKWLVRCDCGTVKLVRRQDLVNGGTVSCGCHAREQSRITASEITHGHARRERRSDTHRVWTNMKQRCLNERHPDYMGDTVSICQRWMTFDNFLRDMGPKPHGLRLGRLDPSRGFNPRNCRWMSMSELMTRVLRGRK